MTTWAMCFWLATAAQASHAICAKNADGFCTDRVVRYSLDYAEPYAIVHINVALGKATMIELAGDGMALAGNPVVGNSAMLRVPDVVGGSTIVIYPTPPPTEARDPGMTEEDLIDQRTNVQISLEGNIHLIVEIRFGTEHEAVERLVVEFPERQRESKYVRDVLAERDARLRQDYTDRESAFEQRVRDRADQMLAQDLLRRFQCRDLSRHAMRDLVALEATRICRIGDRAHIAFKVRNRSRMTFALDSVFLRAPGSQDALKATKVEYSSGTANPFVVFDAEVQGVVTVPVSSGGTSANVFELGVRESGGRGREVLLEDVGL